MSKFVTLHGFGGSGGGTGSVDGELNFQVVAYASEDNMLADTPAENTIGVVTDTDVTNWIFSATEPAEPIDDMVWIKVGASSSTEFNALKNNVLQVYPMVVYQYVNGEFVNVTAKLYHGNNWTFVDPKTYIYNYGVINAELAGSVEFIHGAAGNHTVGNDYIQLGYTGTAGRYSSLYFTKQINLEKCESINFVISELSCSQKVVVGAFSSPCTYVDVANASPAAGVAITSSCTGEQTVSVDVVSLSGSYTIQICAGISTLKIKEIYLL